MFFHEQEKILESYKETIEKLKNERDEAIYRNKANEEKILALQKMQNDQELLEKNLGYFPLKNGYQKNMERTLDSIMQKNENDDYNNDINNKNFMEENRNDQNMNNINDMKTVYEMRHIQHLGIPEIISRTGINRTQIYRSPIPKIIFNI